MSNLPHRLRRMMPQQVTAYDLDFWADHIEELEDDPDRYFCHRFRVLMECMMLSGKTDPLWSEASSLLDEYDKAQRDWREAAGEPYVSGFGKD